MTTDSLTGIKSFLSFINSDDFITLIRDRYAHLKKILPDTDIFRLYNWRETHWDKAHSHNPDLPKFNMEIYGSYLLTAVFLPIQEEEQIDSLKEQIESRAGAPWLNSLFLPQDLPDSKKLCALFQIRTGSAAITLGRIGDLPGTAAARESGLLYGILPMGGQNPGIFPDSRTPRRWVRREASGMRVLNLFSYTCGFSVAAAAGGAEQVINMDMKKGLLERGRENHRLNGQQTGNISFFAHDIMKSFGKMDKLGPYDLIIADPPSAQGRSFSHKKDLPRLLRRIEKMLASKGKLLVMINDPAVDHEYLHNTVTAYTSLIPHECLVSDPDCLTLPVSERVKALVFTAWCGIL